MIRATPLMLGESKTRISDACDFVCTLTMSKAQLEHAAAEEALQARMDQE